MMSSAGVGLHRNVAFNFVVVGGSISLCLVGWWLMQKKNTQKQKTVRDSPPPSVNDHINAVEKSWGKNFIYFVLFIQTKLNFVFVVSY